MLRRLIILSHLLLSKREKKLDPQPKLKFIETKSDIKLRFLITQFILYNRLPFNISTDLAKFIHDVRNNFSKEIILRYSIDHNLITSITRKYISRRVKEGIFQEVSDSPFSLLIDTGSDY